MGKAGIIVIVGMIIAINGGKSNSTGTVLFGLFLIVVGIGSFCFALGSRKKSTGDPSTIINITHNHGEGNGNKNKP